MNRRSFLQSTLAAGVASLVPSWLIAAPRRIDLRPFCGRGTGGQYALSEPFVQEVSSRLMAYGTDGRIAVECDQNNAGNLGTEVRLPPVAKLPWDRECGGWLPWPRQDYLVAADSDCLTCDGYGVVDPVGECQACQGMGEFGEGFMATSCKACKGYGEVGTRCPACKASTPIATRPGIQRVGRIFVNARYDHLVRANLGECEYRISYHVPANGHLLHLRFDGGRALMMSLDQATAEKRIREAR